MSTVVEYFSLFDFFILATLIAIVCGGLWGREHG